MIKKIISGGQTGADRAALDFAIYHDIRHGGWCPKGRLAEDGMIERRYELQETSSKSYPQRTEKNVRDSDGTAIFAQKLTGGSKKLPNSQLARATSPVRVRGQEIATQGYEIRYFMKTLVIVALCIFWLVLAYRQFERGEMLLAGVFLFVGVALTAYRLSKLRG
jgi:hypothetical protein